MGETARENGWRGFESIGTRVHGGWEFQCDGMPTMMGCGETIQISRKWTKTGLKKSSGWLVIYGENDAGDGPDHDVVLTFGPSCAKHVLADMQKKMDAERAALKESKQQTP